MPNRSIAPDEAVNMGLQCRAQCLQVVVLHSAGLVAIDVTPLPMIGDCWRHGEDNLLKKQQRVHGVHSPRARALGRREESQQGDPSHELHHLEKHMQRTPTDYIMWRFAGNDDRESLEFKD